MDDVEISKRAQTPDRTLRDHVGRKLASGRYQWNATACAVFLLLVIFGLVHMDAHPEFAETMLSFSTHIILLIVGFYFGSKEP